VIIPVYAAGAETVGILEDALRNLRESSFRDFEVLVVDDGSPEAEAIEVLVRAARARLVRLDKRSGPATARNAGVVESEGDILAFLDVDALVHQDTLDRIMRKFQENPKLDAVFGAYDRQPTSTGLVSRFRNLLHSFVHTRAHHRAHTFWTGCGAVRKNRFQDLGGFNESYRYPAIEDVEFGLRLCDAGGLIELDPQIQVTHKKSWTLRTMISTDFASRAIPWAGLLYKYHLPFDLNFTFHDRLSVVLTAVTGFLFTIALIHRGAWWFAPLISLSAIALLNWPLFRFLARTTDAMRALFCFPLLLTYLTTCLTGLIAGIAVAENRRDRWLWPAAGIIAATLIAVQAGSGAFQAEFTGHPDEAAHFVSALMIYDYLAILPKTNPVTWAEQYYLHYPKVAIGHWPPAFHLLEAGWWLLFAPSRTTALLLLCLIATVTITILYRLARSSLPLPVTVGVVALAIASPVFQQSLEQTMVDMLCLLWTVLLMDATVRLIKRQDRNACLLVVLWLVGAALTKGTALCLAPVPLVALLASGQRLRIPIRWYIVGVVGFAGAASLYLWMGDVRSWGGMSFNEPWPGGLIGNVAGWGCLGLAILGVQRKPLALAAASVVVSALAVSVFVRAMREDRHWIIVLPAILILAGFGVARFRLAWIAVPLAFSGLLLFPYTFYRQSKAGFGDLLGQVPRPSRMLVSSAGLGEGAWIAVCSVAEKRPGSFIVRATKVLAEEGWNSEGYHLLPQTPAEVLRRLDELAVAVIVIDAPPGSSEPPHQSLLREAVNVSPAWTPCGRSSELRAFCRVKPPEVPRRPLQLLVHGWQFTER